MRAALVASLVALSLVPACTSRVRTPGPDTGVGGNGDSGNGNGGDGSSSLVDTNHDVGLIQGGGCSTAAMQWIYLVDSNNAFLRYDPAANMITSIGTLHCPAGSASPFSMAVSRDAVAYVLYSDYHIYAVSTADASCTTTSFPINQMNFQEFGMGFVSNDVGSNDETLFVAGGPASGIGGGSSTLASIDISSWMLSRIGPVSGSPELTGNGLAQLWGFFPDAMPMAVRQIDKTSGATLQEFDVSAVDTSLIPIPSAWAFAFWGGRDYIFYQGASDNSTGIYRLDPATSAVDTIMSDIGYRIVGAGVSTCAPTAPM
jgi:hypothetical protein